jgi:predicted transcriptional regulator
MCISLNKILLRNRHDIVAGILESALEEPGITKTRVMFKAQLSYNQLKEYIPYLQRRELISYDAKRRVYKTTTKGTSVLELYNTINELASLHRNGDI